jgi:hypothetical protein
MPVATLAMRQLLLASAEPSRCVTGVARYIGPPVTWTTCALYARGTTTHGFLVGFGERLQYPVGSELVAEVAGE